MNLLNLDDISTYSSLFFYAADRSTPNKPSAPARPHPILFLCEDTPSSEDRQYFDFIQAPDSFFVAPSCSGLELFASYGSKILISFLPELSLAFMITYLLAAVTTELAANRPPKTLAVEC